MRDAAADDMTPGDTLSDGMISNGTIAWAESGEPVDYAAAVRLMEERVAQIAAGTSPELVWLTEHPSLYTAGTSAKMGDLLAPGRLPLYQTGRGGEITYHGPGQRIAYVMLDVRRRFRGDVHAFVSALEAWVIDTLRPFGVKGESKAGRVGVWVERGGGTEPAAKIAALGIRIRQGVSFHGVAINVAPDLSQFEGIVPCGIRDAGVTSLADLGVSASMKDVDISLKRAFEARFGAVDDAGEPVGSSGDRVVATPSAT